MAISEEFANQPSDKVKSGGLLFDRKVTRIVTPGTLIDERFLDPSENNFLLAAHVGPSARGDQHETARPDAEETAATAEEEGLSPPCVGLAWLDLSTGDFFTQSVHLPAVASAVARIGPRELILEELSTDGSEDQLSSRLHDYSHLMTYTPTARLEPSSDSASADVACLVPGTDLAAFTEEELSAGNILLRYAKSQLLGVRLKLQPPVRRQLPETMLIDKHSMRALEIKSTLREGRFKGSLLHSVRRTVTSSGSRRLNDWLSMDCLLL